MGECSIRSEKWEQLHAGKEQEVDWITSSALAGLMGTEAVKKTGCTGKERGGQGREAW